MVLGSFHGFLIGSEDSRGGFKAQVFHLTLCKTFATIDETITVTCTAYIVKHARNYSFWSLQQASTDER